MSNLQAKFDNLLSLLKNTNNSLAKQCLEDTEGEVAFHPKKSVCPAAQTLLELYGSSDNSHIEGVGVLIDNLGGMGTETICVWGMDTENGSYSIYTTADDKKLVGIMRTRRTLKEIRKQYFLQKEALAKIGEVPLFDYEASELTFVNRKLIG